MKFFYGDESRPSRAYGVEIGVYMCSNELVELLDSASLENIKEALISEDCIEGAGYAEIPTFYKIRSESTEITQGMLLDKSYGVILDEGDNLRPEIESFISKSFDILEIMDNDSTALVWIKGLKSSSLELQLAVIDEFRIEVTCLQQTAIISNIYIDEELLDAYQEQWSEAEESISGLKVLQVYKKNASVTLKVLIG